MFGNFVLGFSPKLLESYFGTLRVDLNPVVNKILDLSSLSYGLFDFERKFWGWLFGLNFDLDFYIVINISIDSYSHVECDFDTLRTFWCIC